MLEWSQISVPREKENNFVLKEEPVLSVTHIFSWAQSAIVQEARETSLGKS